MRCFVVAGVRGGFIAQSKVIGSAAEQPGTDGPPLCQESGIRENGNRITRSALRFQISAQIIPLPVRSTYQLNSTCELNQIGLQSELRAASYDKHRSQTIARSNLKKKAGAACS